MRKIHLLSIAIAIFALPLTADAGTERNVQVRTGGISLEERAAFDAMRKDYNLRVAFVQADGDYVADVGVRLDSPDGRRVYYEGRTDGPFLFASLAPGSYRLEARYAGRVQERIISVGPSQPQPYLYFRWRESEAPAGTSG